MLICTLTKILIASSSFTISLFFFFNDTATTEIYTLSLHDALPISLEAEKRKLPKICLHAFLGIPKKSRSEEHTSELQSHSDVVCRLVLQQIALVHGDDYICLKPDPPHCRSALNDQRVIRRDDKKAH